MKHTRSFFRLFSFFLVLALGWFFLPSWLPYFFAFALLAPLIGLVVLKIYHAEASYLHLFEIFSVSGLLGLGVYLFLPFPSKIFPALFLGFFLAYEQLRRETLLKKSTISMMFIILLIYGYLIILHQFDVLSVYLLFLALLYAYRHHLEAQGILLVKKTRWGIALMDKLSLWKKTLTLLSDIGIGIGFLGMIAMGAYLIVNLFQVFLQQAQPGISPVLPGIKIPGSPITLPLWYGLIAIFLVAVIHEFSHGVIARLYKLKVKNTGIIMLGPFVGGAFVDVDEKQLQKTKPRKQLAVLAAGPFSNLLTGLIVFLMLSLLFNPFLLSLVSPAGVKISVIPDTPASQAGLHDGMVLFGLGNQSSSQPIKTPEDLLALLNASQINQTLTFLVVENPDPYQNITVQSKKAVPVILGVHPENKTKPYLGVYLAPYVVFKDAVVASYGKTFIELFLIFQQLLFWLFVVSLGIGVANLLPLGPVDGGRMLLVALEHFLPKEKARIIWEKVAIFFLLIIGLILFSPLIKQVLGL